MVHWGFKALGGLAELLEGIGRLGIRIMTGGRWPTVVDPTPQISGSSRLLRAYGANYP